MLATLVLTLAQAAQPGPPDSIDFPRVVWHVPDVYGAPTVTRDAVYSGGEGLFRIDRKTGAVLAVAGAPEKLPEGLHIHPEPGSNFENPIAFVGSPAVAGDRVVGRRTDGDVVAYDRELANQLWHWKSEEQGRTWHAGTLDRGVYYCADGEAVVAIDVASGIEGWRRYLPGPVEMRPAVDGARVYAGTSTGVFQALDRLTGEPVWTQEGYEFGGFGWSEPTVADGVVYVADRGVQRNGTDYLPFNSSPLGVVADRNGALFAFDATTGTPRWATIFGATGFSRPFVDTDVVVAGFGRCVARFDRATGEIDTQSLIRTAPNAFGSPTVVGERVYFGNLDGHLYVVRLADRGLDWAFKVPDAQVSDFVHTGDRVFVSSTRGLFALGPGDPNERSTSGSVLVWQGE